MIDFDAADDFNPEHTEPRTSGARAPGWIAALAIIVLLNAFAVLRWVRLDTRPVAWDEGVHTRNSFEYRDRLAAGDLSGLFMPVYFNYPPLYNLTVIPFLDVPTDVADAGALANVFYLGALIVAVFFIGRRLADDWVGLSAAAVVGVYPIVVYMARQTMLDLALTTWVAWAFYALMRTDGFARRGWAAAFGVLLGLGMLTKWTAAIYLAGPAVPVLWRGVRGGRWGTIFLAALAGAVVMAPWYVLNVVPMLTRVTALKDLPPAGGTWLTGAASLLWYPIGLFEQMNLPLLLLFLVGLVLSFREPELRPALLWFVVSLAMFTLIHNRNTRYSLPALPAAALLSVCWVRRRPAGFGFVALVAGVFYVLFNFTAPAPAIAHLKGVPLPLFDNHPPLQEDWKHKEIIAAVDAARAGSTTFDRVVVVANAPHLHSTTLNITARRAGAEGFSFRGPSKRRWTDFASFILLKTGDLGPEFTIENTKACADWMANAPAWFQTVYKEKGRWPLPDGSEAILYHAEPEPRNVSENDLFSLSLGQLEMPNVIAHNVEVRAVPISASDTARGRLDSVSVACSTVSFKGIEVTGIALTLDRPQINLPRYRDDAEIQMLSLERVRVKASIGAASILDYARKKAKWLKDPSVRFEGDRVLVTGNARGIGIEIAVRLIVEADALQPRLERLRVGGVPIPTIFVRALTDRRFPLKANREAPFTIDVGRIVGDGDVLQVGA